MSPTARPLSPDERALVAFLWGLTETGNALPPETLVDVMNDGGMGSLSFISNKAHRKFGIIAGECGFADADGVDVQAALLLDQDGDPFELEIWRVDFGPLIRIAPVASCYPLPTSENGS